MASEVTTWCLAYTPAQGGGMGAAVGREHSKPINGAKPYNAPWGLNRVPFQPLLADGQQNHAAEAPQPTTASITAHHGERDWGHHSYDHDTTCVTTQPRHNYNYNPDASNGLLHAPASGQGYA